LIYTNPAPLGAIAGNGKAIYKNKASAGTGEEVIFLKIYGS
jgi:hypothetical protein